MRRSYRHRLCLASWCSLASSWMIPAVHGEQQFARPPARQQQHQYSQHQPPPFWGLSSLPSVPKQGKHFMDECEDFVAFLQRFRGGSDYNKNYDGYNNDGGYGGESRNAEYYSDDDRDDYGGGSGGGGRRQDDYYYDRPEKKSSSSASAFIDSLPSIFKKGDRKIGLSLVGGGAVITMLGISLFFNKALLRLGNLLFIAGVALTMGISRTVSFFFKPEKLRATACLGLGIFLVFIGSPVFGMILEVFGLLNLFGNMFPMLLAIAKTLPGIGPILTNNSNKKKKNSSKQSSSSRRSDYYDDYEDKGDGYNDGSSYNGYYDDRGSRGGNEQDDRYKDGYY
eukprot:CAMPEP_0198144538 /NCGR_PEP_ID=MMETSP1443-20131203/16423_1 /TAXON_ID=186043 /ORGANISM="Entomoneis sp., Strain CCMP2396" /LENGTH=337 /DNA_ID=CAMNT_0043807945 /DNA_START=141 /DNA_END=1154 /DNA_ORIENTATION=+